MIIFCRSKHSTLPTLIKITSKFLINYIKTKKGKAFWKVTLEGLLTIVKFDVFLKGDDIVTQNSNIQLNATRTTGNASSSSLLISSNNSEKDPHFFLKDLRINNINRLITGQLNINSSRSKFEQLSTMISENIEIPMLSETKLDKTFPVAQFLLQGFCLPHRFDRHRNDSGIMLYIREDIPSRLIERNNVEFFFDEINFRKKKWLLCCSFNPHKNCISNCVEVLRTELDIKIFYY